MNVKRLKDEMKRAGISISEMCAALHISRSAFYRKCYGKSEFTLPEVQKIVGILGLESPMDIFFTAEVSEKTQQQEA